MFRKLLVLIGAACALATLPASAQQSVARAPLDLFVGYDTLREPDLSPNGRYIALVRREPVGDVLIIFDRQTRQSQAIQTARADQQMRIDFVSFKTDDRIVFGFSQKVHVVAATGSARVGSRADDAFEWVSRVYASDITGANRISLYDPSSQSGLPRWVNAQIADMLPRDDNNVLMVAPKAGGAELWRINVRTGDHTTVDRGGLYTFNWVVDSEGIPVLRQDVIANGRGYAWSRRGRGQNSWTEIIRFRGAEGANSGPTFQGLGPAVAPGQVFVLARRDNDDTSGLYVYDAGTGQYVETVETNPDFDVSSAIRDLDNNKILAACWWGHRWECDPKDETFGRYWVGVTRALGDQLNVRLEARGGERGELWLLRTNGPQDLGTYRLYNIETRQLATLFTVRPTADASLLPTQRVVQYTARDGTQLWGYLWIPPGVTNATNLPTIVVPHGGPEGRDVWGFDPFAMTFASQGYAVFQPNFRGGGGFGRRFVEAGHRQWGLRMQDDVVDGARYLIQQGITDPNRICITGWSYGGYVAMTASFQNADVFKCSVAGAGVSDMVAMQRWVRAGPRDADVASGGGQGSQSMSYRYWTEAMGDPDTDRAMMDAHSAAQNADRVGMPLLLIHGEEDETVPIEQSQLMVRAMQRAGKQVRLVELPDTNHYFRPDQGDAWRTVFTESLAFYQQNIGPGVAPGSQ
ncbi:alpha/beta hydrolase family protein [Terricaulis sp.]|uniref:alpha/beta hydrolase family protein n=1 Tax=Terricaulis sp. TaxID=2768686 RepID=UPI003783356B